MSLSPPPLLCALLHFYCHRGKSTLASARPFSRTAELFCNCNWEYSWQPTTIWNADLCLLLLEASVKRWWNLKWRRKKAKSPQSCSFSGKKVKASDLLHFTFTSPSHFVSHFGAPLSTTNFRHRRSRRSANFGCIEFERINEHTIHNCSIIGNGGFYRLADRRVRVFCLWNCQVHSLYRRRLLNLNYITINNPPVSK